MKTDCLKELETIGRRHGGVLRPDDVVQFATNPRTALHGQFCWDNDVAGHQYRIWQARMLIRVTVGILPGTEEKSRVFVSMMADRVQDRGGYRAMATVLSDATQRELLLEEALAELEAFKQKYRHLRELAGVFAAIEDVPKGKRQKV